MAKDYMAAQGIDLDSEMSKVQFGNVSTPSNQQPKTISRILNVRLPKKDPGSFWDVSMAGGKISSIEPHNESTTDRICHLPVVLDGRGRLLAPSLCHAHIHLDKCFLLQDPEFSDLVPQEGTFGEALKITETAKSRFTIENLLKRGRQLLEESISFGVTAIRAFVEVDPTVGFTCLDAGLMLRREFAGRCEVQICAFAQQPLFKSRDVEGPVWAMMREAAEREDVGVIGSTPYVEPDEECSKENIRMMIRLARDRSKALDFHLDYFLDKQKQPLAPLIPEMLAQNQWPQRTTDTKGVVLGHCTRLTLLSDKEWRDFEDRLHAYRVAFVGLPTSDLFMMHSENRARGTLDVLDINKNHKCLAAMGVNNVGNAFTPYGNCDPLTVASLGVGLYHAMTPADAEILFQCVSNFAKDAMGLSFTSLDMAPGDNADLVLFDEKNAGWRLRKSIAEAVYDGGSQRLTIYRGRVVSRI